MTTRQLTNRFKTLKPFSRATKVNTALKYPGEPSEMEVVFVIFEALRRAGLDARCEVTAPGANSRNRMDIVVFGDDRKVLRIIEVKKRRSASRHMGKGGMMHRSLSPGAAKRQCNRYAQFGPVDLVCGMKAALKYVSRSGWQEEHDGSEIRVFG